MQVAIRVSVPGAQELPERGDEEKRHDQGINAGDILEGFDGIAYDLPAARVLRVRPEAGQAELHSDAAGQAIA